LSAMLFPCMSNKVCGKTYSLILVFVSIRQMIHF
jgi:hypothetical protein